MRRNAHGRRSAARRAPASIEFIANQVASTAFAEAFNGVITAAGKKHPNATVDQVVDAFHAAMRSRLEWLESSRAAPGAKGGALMSSPSTPAKLIDVSALVSADTAARQEAARSHARMALQLTQELLELAELTGAHRKQLEETLPFLEEAVDYLGPVEEFEEPTKEGRS